jgi:hypothetical protein
LIAFSNGLVTVTIILSTGCPASAITFILEGDFWKQTSLHFKYAKNPYNTKKIKVLKPLMFDKKIIHYLALFVILL